MTDINERLQEALRKTSNEIAQFTVDCQYIDNHWDELVKEHPDEWAGVHNGEMFFEKTLSGLLKTMGRRANHCAIRYLDANPEALILIAA